ncbi:MAG: hypothetical protein ACSHYF_06155 [Verrucomicrobiaceae bacterium]
MKNATLIARILLGAAFLTFGLNYYLGFLSMPPQEGLAGQFMGAIYQSGYLGVVKNIEIAGGLLLLTGRYAPLGLTLLGPVVINIALFDVFLAKAFNPVGALVGVLSLFLLIAWRGNFKGLVAAPRG